MRSEAIRERDLQRYYRPWLDAQDLVNAADGRGKSLTYEGFQAKSSQDKSLTAFAQLATLRLDVRRCMVSLIDSNRQYILAEATRTLSLFTQNAEEKEDEVWLGHSVIARNDAVCHHCFTSTYTTTEDNGEEYIAEALVIPDCREDPRFATRDYVVAEPGVRFYAGVPIVTKNGHRIGVYAVSDEKPRDGLKAADIRFLQDVAAAVMEHLELAKASEARNTGERMVRGLTEFIERSSLQDLRNSSHHRATTLEKQTENARLEAIADEEPAEALPAAAKLPQRRREHEREADTARIFQRAARIIRQSTHADGVVFFDTSAAHVGVGWEDPTPPASSDENSYSSATAGSATASRKQSLRRARSGKLAPPVETVPDALPNAESKPCPLAGLSCRQSGVGVTEADFVFTEANMERYINRYPQGKFFNFDAEGTGINSSDEKSERSEPEHIDKAAQIANATRRLRKGKDRFIPTEFLKILPNVRSLIFLPLWDPAAERWAAGGFIWTNATGKLLDPENELPYLKAFGNSITSEVARWNALKSDRAKTTFIASISHELRSPLHGILGSVEFLRDAVSSAYQQSLVSSIETCGKTLLDTIDHVLDYAKINKLRSASIKRKQRGERSRRVPADNSILGVTTVFNLAQLVEEVCDTVCAGHTFRKTHDIHNATFHDQGSRFKVNTKSDERKASSSGTDLSGNKSDNVVVTLNVAPFMPWIVRSQPGALRRVVMNLLGNSLKYTESGFITVSLTQNKERSNSQAVEFDIAVEDSGRGMSTEYQNTKLFAPFSQEDPFSNGTGLGLSIVKQIVESLKGNVDVKSTLNVGTTITVSLRLPAGSASQVRASPLLMETTQEFRDKTASILFPDHSLGGAGGKLRQSFTTLCNGFYIKTYEDFDENSYPDFLITEIDSLLDLLDKQKEKGTFAHTPLSVICLCTDPTEKATLESRIHTHHPHNPWAIEVTTQPCGPRKLAQLLLDGQKKASHRLQTLQLRPAAPSPAPSFTLEIPSDPKHLIQRSISELAAGPKAVPASIQSSHSPLISANMPAGPISPGDDLVAHQTHPALPLSHMRLPASPTTPSSATSATSYFPPPRVLLVDDNAINLKLLVVFAQRQALTYSSATNGLEALNLYKERALATSPAAEPFDFILMDLSMPVMGGLEATRLIRVFEAERELRRCTVVALTGLASAKDQEDAFDAGVDEYLVKPVKFADVRRVFGTK